MTKTSRKMMSRIELLTVAMGGHMTAYRYTEDGYEVRPNDIFAIDACQAAAEKLAGRYGITAIVMDPEIYDAT